MLVRALVLGEAPDPAAVPDPAPPPPTADALKAAGEILKVSTGLATATLVFSIGLLPGAEVSGPAIRAVLALTWVALFLSIIGGILSQSAVPVLLSEGRFDIEAWTFTWPGRAHQVLFGVGILGLSAVLLATLYSGASALRVGSAGHAVLYAKSVLRPGEVADRVELVQLVRGADPARPDLQTWQVRLRLAPGRDGAAATVDMLIDAKRGTLSRTP